MGNWALVVGINEYRNDQYGKSPRLQLQGSVHDALRMCAWLLHPHGGNVPKNSLYVLLSPAPPLDQRRITITDPATGNQIVHTLDVGDPTRDGLVSAVANLQRRSRLEPSCDRLFFHFSGHGITAVQRLKVPQSGILLRDFSTENPDNSLSIDSIKDYFAATPFADQFFFIDACRDLPIDPEFLLGEFPRYPVREPHWPTVQQFLMYATSPGQKAAQIEGGGATGGAGGSAPGAHERGAFTTALLAGLDGHGAAKRFQEDDDADTGRFVVRWKTLFEYVQHAVARLKLPFVQEPQQDGQRGGGLARDADPLLATLPAERFKEEPLSVTLDPGAAAGGAILEVCESGDAKPIKTLGKPCPVPAVFDLLPRSYVVIARADKYKSRKRRWPIDVYEATSLDVRLDPDASASADLPEPAPPVPPSPTLRDRAKHAAGDALREFFSPFFELFRPFSIGPSSYPSGAGAPGEVKTGLTVLNADPYLPIKIIDSAGRPVESTNWGPRRFILKPGTYVVRTVTPEGLASEEHLDLAPGESEEVTLKSAADYAGAVMQDILKLAGSVIDEEDRTIRVADQVSPIATAELSTIITLAAAQAAIGNPSPRWGNLVKIGLPPVEFPHDARGGVYLVFADDVPDAQPGIPWNHVQLSLRSASGVPITARPTPATGVSYAAAFSAPLIPGRFHLQIAAPGRTPVLFPLIALPDRLTLVVFARRRNEDIHVFLYMPSLRPLTPFDPDDVRRLELAQRFLLRGHYDEVGEPEDLASLSWSAPVGRCLAAYLLLRRKDFKQARQQASRLLADFPHLTDAHVILAECSAAEGAHDLAEASTRAALADGVPLFVGGLALLRAAVERHAPSAGADLHAALAHRVPGLLWTAYDPTRE